MRLQTKFTSIFTLEKGKVFTADNPVIMYERKTFALSYKAGVLVCDGRIYFLDGDWFAERISETGHEDALSQLVPSP